MKVCPINGSSPVFLRHTVENVKSGKWQLMH